jgi:hypothetical protein
MSSPAATGDAPKADAGAAITDAELMSIRQFVDATCRSTGGLTSAGMPVPERARCPGCGKAIQSVIQAYRSNTSRERLDVAVHPSSTEGICVISNDAETNGFAEQLGKAIRSAAVSGILKCKATHVVLKR